MITLNYPNVSSTISIQLPNPRLRDVEHVDHDVKYHVTMNADMYSYVDSSVDNKILLTFENLTQRELNLLKHLLYSVADDNLVELIDYSGNVYHGVFLNNPFSSESGKNFKKLTLDFMAAKQ